MIVDKKKFRISNKEVNEKLCIIEIKRTALLGQKNTSDLKRLRRWIAARQLRRKQPRTQRIQWEQRRQRHLSYYKNVVRRLRARRSHRIQRARLMRSVFRYFRWFSFCVTHRYKKRFLLFKKIKQWKRKRCVRISKRDKRRYAYLIKKIKQWKRKRCVRISKRGKRRHIYLIKKIKQWKRWEHRYVLKEVRALLRKKEYFFKKKLRPRARLLRAKLHSGANRRLLKQKVRKFTLKWVLTLLKPHKKFQFFMRTLGSRPQYKPTMYYRKKRLRAVVQFKNIHVILREMRDIELKAAFWKYWPKKRRILSIWLQRFQEKVKPSFKLKNIDKHAPSRTIRSQSRRTYNFKKWKFFRAGLAKSTPITFARYRWKYSKNLMLNAPFTVDKQAQRVKRCAAYYQTARVLFTKPRILIRLKKWKKNVFRELRSRAKPARIRYYTEAELVRRHVYRIIARSYKRRFLKFKVRIRRRGVKGLRRLTVRTLRKNYQQRKQRSMFHSKQFALTPTRASISTTIITKLPLQPCENIKQRLLASRQRKQRVTTKNNLQFSKKRNILVFSCKSRWSSIFRTKKQKTPLRPKKIITNEIALNFYAYPQLQNNLFLRNLNYSNLYHEVVPVKMNSKGPKSIKIIQHAPQSRVYYASEVNVVHADKRLPAPSKNQVMRRSLLFNKIKIRTHYFTQNTRVSIKQKSKKKEKKTLYVDKTRLNQKNCSNFNVVIAKNNWRRSLQKKRWVPRFTKHARVTTLQRGAVSYCYAQRPMLPIYSSIFSYKIKAKRKRAQLYKIAGSHLAWRRIQQRKQIAKQDRRAEKIMNTWLAGRKNCNLLLIRANVQTFYQKLLNKKHRSLPIEQHEYNELYVCACSGLLTSTELTVALKVKLLKKLSKYGQYPYWINAPDCGRRVLQNNKLPRKRGRLPAAGLFQQRKISKMLAHNLVKRKLKSKIRITDTYKLLQKSAARELLLTKKINNTAVSKILKNLGIKKKYSPQVKKKMPLMRRTVIARPRVQPSMSLSKVIMQKKNLHLKAKRRKRCMLSSLRRWTLARYSYMRAGQKLKKCRKLVEKNKQQSYALRNWLATMRKVKYKKQYLKRVRLKFVYLRSRFKCTKKLRRRRWSKQTQIRRAAALVRRLPPRHAIKRTYTARKQQWLYRLFRRCKTTRRYRRPRRTKKYAPLWVKRHAYRVRGPAKRRYWRLCYRSYSKRKYKKYSKILDKTQRKRQKHRKRSLRKITYKALRYHRPTARHRHFFARLQQTIDGATVAIYRRESRGFPYQNFMKFNGAYRNTIVKSSNISDSVLLPFARRDLRVFALLSVRQSPTPFTAVQSTQQGQVKGNNSLQKLREAHSGAISRISILENISCTIAVNIPKKQQDDKTIEDVSISWEEWRQRRRKARWLRARTWMINKKIKRRVARHRKRYARKRECVQRLRNVVLLRKNIKKRIAVLTQTKKVNMLTKKIIKKHIIASWTKPQKQLVKGALVTSRNKPNKIILKGKLHGIVNTAAALRVEEDFKSIKPLKAEAHIPKICPKAQPCSTSTPSSQDKRFLELQIIRILISKDILLPNTEKRCEAKELYKNIVSPEGKSVASQQEDIRMYANAGFLEEKEIEMLVKHNVLINQKTKYPVWGEKNIHLALVPPYSQMKSSEILEFVNKGIADCLAVVHKGAQEAASTKLAKKITSEDTSSLKFYALRGFLCDENIAKLIRVGAIPEIPDGSWVKGYVTWNRKSSLESQKPVGMEEMYQHEQKRCRARALYEKVTSSVEVDCNTKERENSRDELTEFATKGFLEDNEVGTAVRRGLIKRHKSGFRYSTWEGENLVTLRSRQFVYEQFSLWKRQICDK